MADAIVAGGKNGVVRRLLPTDKKFYVYVHSRLSTGEPFYIGKGNGKRARKRDGRNLHWKNIVKKDGGFHKSFLVKDVDEELAMLVEIEAIDLYRRRGCSLANYTDGGEGASGMKHDPQTVARLAAQKRGRPLSPQTMAAALAYHLGRKLSPEHIAKIAKANKGKRRTPEQIKKIADGNRGKKRSEEVRKQMSLIRIGKPSKKKGVPMSEEQKAKLSAAKKGKPSTRLGCKMSEEQKLKLSEANKGKVHSTEAREKIKAFHLARWAAIRRRCLEAGELSETGKIYLGKRDWHGRLIT